MKNTGMQMIKPRDRVLSVLRGEQPDRIPFFEDFGDLDAENKFIPAYAGLIARGTRPAQRRNPAQMIEMLRFLDRDIAEAGNARLRIEIIAKSDNEETVRYENGAVWRYKTNPACTEPLALPLDDGGDPENIYMPDPSDLERYRKTGEDIAFFKAQGYFTLVKLHGFFSGAHYLFRRFEDLLIDMATNKQYAEAIIRRVGDYTVACAGEILNLGADGIFIGDDLGSTNSLLISPAMYRQFIQPWHARLAELCHKHNAFLHVHSHGHLLPIIDDLMDAGIDMMDPLGPGDGIDLNDLLPRCRGRMVIAGGISKFIGRMTLNDLEMHLKETLACGARHGGFIMRSEGGIPADMSREAFELYLKRGRYYRTNN